MATRDAANRAGFADDAIRQGEHATPTDKANQADVRPGDPDRRKGKKATANPTATAGASIRHLSNSSISMALLRVR